MADYTPGWAFVFPEPRDEGDGYIGRSTGPKRERPGICPNCGDEMRHPSAFGDPTCGESACRQAWLTRPEARMR